MMCSARHKIIISCKNSAQRITSLLEIMDKCVDSQFVVLHYCVCIDRGKDQWIGEGKGMLNNFPTGLSLAVKSLDNTHLINDESHIKTFQFSLSYSLSLSLFLSYRFL